MAAGYEQREERNRGAIAFEQWGEQVSFHMMYADRGHVPGAGKRSTHRRADEQRAGEPGARSVGDAVGGQTLHPRFLQHFAN